MRESKLWRRVVAVDERQREIEYDLAGQVLCAGRFQRRERYGAGGRVDDQLAVYARLGKGDEPHVGVGLLPLGIRFDALAVGLGARQRVLRVAGADDEIVAELSQPAGERAA